MSHPDHRPPTAKAAALPASRWNATDLSLVAVFAAMVAASIMVPPIPAGNVLGVPLTLQTLVVTLTGLTLGAARAAAAVGLYVVVGLAGLPIFAGFNGGLGVLAGGSAGYLVSFPLAAAVVGALAALAVRSRARFRGLGLFGATLAGLVVTHGLGILGMMVNGHLSLSAAVLADMPFIPGDIVKNLAAVFVALALHRAFPDLLVRRRR